MNMIKLTSLVGQLLLALVLISGISCAKKSGNSEGPEEVMFVHGDPMTLVAGTNLRTKSTLLPGFFKPGASYFVSRRSFVRQSVQRTRTSWNQVKDEAKTSQWTAGEIQEYLTDRTLTVKTTGAGVLLEGSYYSFAFDETDGNLRFASFVADDEKWVSGTDYESIHYSVNTNNGTFSVLIRTVTSSIIAFTFMPFDRSKNTFIEDGSSFNYLIGPGHPVSWKGISRLPISFCSPGESVFERLAKESVPVWNDVLKNRFQMSLQTKKCPPFSDVNERGIYLIDVYMSTPLKISTAATTLPTYDPTIGKMVDSDIFINRSEIYDKHGAGEYRSSAFYGRVTPTRLRRTVIHELGHLLGLHHNMDVPSIMNYDDEGDALTDYDKKAIQHLYPLRTE